MSRETKVGLLVGMGVILLVGIIVSDHLAVVQDQDAAELTRLAEQAERSIHRGDAAEASWRTRPVPAPPQEQISQGPPPRAERQTETEPQRESTSQRRRDVPSLLLTHETLGTPRQPEPQPEPRQEPEPAGGGDQGEPLTHRVQRGESLYAIAERYYDDGEYWRSLMEYNQDRVGEGGRITVGTELKLPGLADHEAFEPAGRERAIRVDDLARDRGEAGGRTIEVRSGDTLSSLAARHLGSSGRWRALLEANRDRLDSPERLQAGMELRLPGEVNGGDREAEPRRRTYTVRPGDTLSRIAGRELGDPGRWRELFELNEEKLGEPDRLAAGQEIVLP